MTELYPICSSDIVLLAAFLFSIETSLGHDFLVLGHIDLASSKSSRQRKLTLNTIDTVGGVQVLDNGDLVASCTSLAGDDG